MKPGDKVRVVWDDGEEAIGFFIREERGFAVFETSDVYRRKFVAVMNKGYTSFSIIESDAAISKKEMQKKED